MSYPFTTFPLVNRVGVTNPYANIDARYGPWLSLTDALTSYNAGLRFRGLTVGIYEPNFNTNGSIIEYWFKDGVADNNLVVKTAGGGGSGTPGATGATGLIGGTGATGFIGGTGATGATGLIGGTGATGFTGGTGATGMGATGATGFIGGTGATGFTGSSGATGLPGDKYFTTSNTNHSISLGLKTFTVAAGLAYSTSQTVIIANDSTNFMKAVVTNYTSNQLSVNVTVLNGTGTFSSWQINLEGAPGAQGPQGATGIGATGATGATGLIGGTGATGFQGATGLVDSTITTFVTANSANWAQAVLNLPNNLAPNTVTSINASQFGTVYQTVSADQTYTVDLRPGRTLTLFISGNHESLKRHTIGFINPFAFQFYIAGAGQSSHFYTFKNHVTKVTLTNPLTSIAPIPILMGIGTAEVIRTDLNQNQGGLGYLQTESLQDPVFTNVTLLLHMDGSNGSTTFTDSSNFNRTIVRQGNPVISNSIIKFGSGSGFFNNSSNLTNNDTDMRLDSGNFTAEAWIYPLDINATGPIICQGNVDQTGGFIIYRTFSTGALAFYADNALRLITDSIASANAWTHIALVKNGNVYRFFINGVAQANAYTGTHNHSLLPFQIGAGYTIIGSFNGYIDEVRITKGVARYLTNFTPLNTPFADSTSSTSPVSILQENGDRLVIRNFT